MTGGQFTIPIDRDKMKYIDRSATLFVPFNFVKRWYKNNDFEIQYLSKMYVRPFKCQSSGDTFILSSSDVSLAVETIKDENGLSDSRNIDSGSPSSDGSSGIWDASISIDPPNWMVCSIYNDFKWE